MALTLVHSRPGSGESAEPRAAHAEKRDLPAFLDAMSARQLASILTAAGGVVVMVLQVIYAVYAQGWGTPLP